ncbi:MAG: amidohydrolase family protein [bacterium]
MFDLIVEKGEVVDGGGTKKKFRADVGIVGDKIDAVGDLSKAEAKARLDAAGCVVTPGFIDAHSHSDIHVLINPNAESKLHQGITSEVVGNCGWSAFPMKGAFRDREQEDWKPYDYEVKWAGVKEYLKLFDKAKPSINLASFVGQGNVRGAVMGFSPDRPSKDQQRAMEREVEEAMEAGAIGLSTGLIYTPGFFASTDEIVGLAKVVKKHGGMYSSHIRSEGDQLEEAVDEALSWGARR